MMSSEKSQKITSKEGLQQTISCIELMCHSLHSLVEDQLDKSPQWFAIMAEGPVDQIRDLLDEVDAYISGITKPLAEEADAREAQHSTEAEREEKAA